MDNPRARDAMQWTPHERIAVHRIGKMPNSCLAGTRCVSRSEPTGQEVVNSIECLSLRLFFPSGSAEGSRLERSAISKGIRCNVPWARSSGLPKIAGSE